MNINEKIDLVSRLSKSGPELESYVKGKINQLNNDSDIDDVSREGIVDALISDVKTYSQVQVSKLYLTLGITGCLDALLILFAKINPLGALVLGTTSTLAGIYLVKKYMSSYNEIKNI